MTPPMPSTLRAYVLGQLSGEAAERVEEACFTRPDVAALLEDVEDDLARAYRSGALTPFERAAFERLMVRDPTMQARVEFVDGLARHRLPLADGVESRALLPDAASTTRGLLASAAILAVAFGLSSWRWQPGGTATPASVLNEPAPADTPAASTAPVPHRVLAMLTLPAVAVRSAGTMPTVVLPPDAVALVLQLQERLPARALSAEVRSVDTDSVWRGPVRAPARVASGITAEVEVPTSELAAGDYVLAVRDQSGLDLTRSTFRVQRP